MADKFRKGRTDTASKVVNASPRTLYEAYTDPAQLVQWLPPSGMSAHVEIFEPFEGGKFHITLTYESLENYSGKTTENTDVMEGRFLELVPYKRIVQTGRFQSDDPTYLRRDH